MSEWKTVRLGDVCEIAAGQGAPQGDSNYCNDGTPFVKAGNLIELIEGKHENQIQKVSEEVAKSHKLKKYSAGSILFAKSGMSCMKGYVYQLKNDSYVVSHLAIVKPKEDSSDYIEYCLRHIKPNTLVKDEAYPSISLQDISNLQIPLPPLEKQKHIANVLDKCTILIAKYKQMLAKYDTLIKSRFIEMFSSQKDSFSFCTLDTVSSRIFAGGDRPKETSETKNDEFQYPVFANAETNKGLLCYSKTYQVELPCVTIAARGCTVGYTEVRNEKFTPVVRLLTIIPTKEIKPLFLKYYLDLEMKIEGNGAAQPQLTVPTVKKYQIYVPSLTLQNDFATFVHQIDKSKFEYTYTGVAA